LASIVADIADRLPKEDPNKGKMASTEKDKRELATIVAGIADYLPKEDPNKGIGCSYT
jgi:hypothetical protein